jgi:hypothetical protein
MPDGVRLHLHFRQVGGARVETFDFVNVVFVVEGLYRVGAASDPEVTDYLEREQIEWAERQLPIVSALPEALRLGVESLGMRSPLDLILLIPDAFLVLGAGAAFPRFLTGLERAWNMPGRIRVERVRLRRLEREERRREWEERLAEDKARDEYYEHVASKSNFQLEAGEAWDWPQEPEPPPG